MAIRFPTEQAPPTWAQRGRDRRTRRDEGGSGESPDFAEINEVRLFFGIGHRSGVRPGDLVGAIANDTGLSGKRIGKVNIFAHKSFVSFSRDDAQRILEKHSTISVRGKTVRVSEARADVHGDGTPARAEQRGRGKGPWRPKSNHRGKYDRTRQSSNRKKKR